MDIFILFISISIGEKILSTVMETAANSTTGKDSVVEVARSLSFLSQYLKALTFIPFSLLQATCERLLALNSSTRFFQISLLSSNFKKDTPP